MRKTLVLAVTLIVGLAMTTVAPAGAAPVEKAEYQFMECFTSLDPEPERSWFSGKNDRNWHLRGADNMAAEYVWDEGEELWVDVGTNDTTGNWNARWMLVEVLPNVFLPIPTEGSLWGDFHLTLDPFDDFEGGEFEGTWSWANWPDRDGRGSGKGIGDSAGLKVKVTLLAENPGLPEVPAATCFDPGFVILEVIG